MDSKDYVYEVYLEKSFTRAAAKLFISQPALSAAIKKIENEIGHELFDRSSSPVRLTQAGEYYISALEEMYNIKNNLTNKLNDISNLRTGKICVSGANFISSHVIPEIIKKFSETYPGISIELLESNSNDLLEQLFDEKIDLLIDYAVDEQQVISHPLFNEHILIAVPSDVSINRSLTDCALTCDDIKKRHHLSDDCPTVSLKKFEGERFILLKKGNNMYNQARMMISESELTPGKVIFLDQLMTSYKFTEAGMGISFVTDTLIKSSATGDGVVFYKPASRCAERTLYISHKKGRYIKKAVTAFIDTAQSLY